MNHPRPLLLFFLQTLALALCMAQPTAASVQETPKPPKVLILCPEIDDLVTGYRDLLVSADIPVSALRWQDATDELARDCDLIMVIGPGRQIDKKHLLASFERPVLGLGAYGGGLFGHMDLKNGQPYS